MADRATKEAMSSYKTAALQVITYKKLQNRINVVLKQYGLNMTQWIILGRLREKDTGQRTTDLARYMHVEVPLVTMVSQPLLGRGLIDTTKAVNDKRAKLLKLTGAAQELMDTVEGRLQTQFQELIRDIPRQELNTYFKVLKTMGSTT
jgi:DNA-binding MarR family transcriptional regulator